MVSVIIPVYNVENYICRCLDSLFKQTYQDFEIILVDDCGQDGSVDRAKAYIENHQWGEKVQYVHHDKNRGPSVARNSGIHAARGEFIFFIDGDDTISTDCLELMVHHAQYDDVDYVMAKCDYVLPGGKIDSNIYLFKNSCVVDCEKLTNFYRKKIILWNVWNKLIRRRFITDNNLYFESEVMAEDLLWNFCSLLHIRKVLLLDVHTYQYYRDRVGSTTFSAKAGTESTADDMVDVIEKCENKLKRTLPNRHVIELYLELRYRYLPFNVFWHGYSNEKKREVLYKIFNGRLRRYFGILPLYKKILFVFPFSFIYQLYRMKFYGSEFKWAIRNKIIQLVTIRKESV